jgi:uncharacterized protein YbcI
MSLDGTQIAPANGTAPVDIGTVAARISREIVQLNARLFGRGPVRARTFINRDYALCVLESIFTTAERTLIELGKENEVRRSRAAFAATTEAEICRIVEEATGRTVRGCTSAINTELDISTNVFLFESSS